MKHKKGIAGIYWVVVAAIAFLILIFMIHFITVGMGGGATEMMEIQESITDQIEQERIEHLNQLKSLNERTCCR